MVTARPLLQCHQSVADEGVQCMGSVRQQRRVALRALGDVEHVGGENQLIGVDVDGEQANGSHRQRRGTGNLRGAPVVEFSSLPFLHAETYSPRTSVILVVRVFVSEGHSASRWYKGSGCVDPCAAAAALIRLRGSVRAAAACRFSSSCVHIHGSDSQWVRHASMRQIRRLSLVQIHGRAHGGTVVPRADLPRELRWPASAFRTRQLEQRANSVGASFAAPVPGHQRQQSGWPCVSRQTEKVREVEQRLAGGFTSWAQPFLGADPS
jgi:hypothetical protein